MLRIARLVIVVAALTASLLPATAHAGEVRQSGCSVRNWSGDQECSFTYQGTTLAAGFYGTGVLTVEKDGPLGTRKVILTCVAASGGCIAGRSESQESMPIGAPLYCHIRGDSGSKFACLSRTPPVDGETVWV